VDRERVAIAVLAPEPLEQLLAGEDLARVTSQVLQQLELAGRERHRLPGDPDLVRPHVDGESAVVEHRVGRRRSTPADTPEDGPDPGDHLGG
jgi:hypothetical protein